MRFTCFCLKHTTRCWRLNDYIAPALLINLLMFFKFFVVSRLRKNPNRLQMLSQLEPNIVLALKGGAYYCYCAYVLRIFRYSDFLSVMLTNTGILLRSLKLSGESRS